MKLLDKLEPLVYTMRLEVSHVEENTGRKATKAPCGCLSGRQSRLEEESGEKSKET